MGEFFLVTQFNLGYTRPFFLPTRQKNVRSFSFSPISNQSQTETTGAEWGSPWLSQAHAMC